MVSKLILIFFLLLNIFSSSLIDGRSIQKSLQKEKNDHHQSPPAHHHQHHHQNGNQSKNQQNTSTTTNPTDIFCQSFIKECYHQGLHGKRGQIQMKFTCERHGNKYSPNYAFICKADGVDLTKSVLNAVTESKQGSTSTTIITNNVTETVATTYSTTIDEVYQTVTADTSITSNTTQLNIESPTTTISTTITTAIPYTSVTTSISTIVTSIPITSTVATSTVTATTTSTRGMPGSVIRIVSPKNSTNRKRKNSVDNSEFCSAYSQSCQSQCSRVSSKPYYIACEGDNKDQYYLTCNCKNGKDETQHALAAAINEQKIGSISTISTSTRYSTILTTQIIPTTIYSTSFITKTSSIPITNTFTSYSTATQTVTNTKYTGSSDPIATSTPISYVTSSVPYTTSVTATSTTTQIVLAPTGAVYVNDYIDYLGYLQNNGANGISVDYQYETALKYLAVVDPSSGYLQLLTTDGSGRAITVIEEQVDSQFDKFYLRLDYPSNCGTAGIMAGSADGSSNCESFIFAPVGNGGSQFYINPDIYKYADIGPTQFNWYLYYGNVYAASQASAFQGTTPSQLFLTYPAGEPN